MTPRVAIALLRDIAEIRREELEAEKWLEPLTLAYRVLSRLEIRAFAAAQSESPPRQRWARAECWFCDASEAHADGAQPEGWAYCDLDGFGGWRLLCATCAQRRAERTVSS